MNLQLDRRSVYRHVLVLLFCFHTPLYSQDVETVFVHGLLGNSTTWASTANKLYQDYEINPLLVSLGWNNQFSVQANNLNGLITSNGIPAFGHSNGGLVLRTYAQAFPTGKIDRSMTVGTPHGGAPLAESLLDGEVAHYGMRLWSAYTIRLVTTSLTTPISTISGLSSIQISMWHR